MSGELVTVLISGFGIPLALRIIAHYVPWLDLTAAPKPSKPNTKEGDE